MLRSGNRLAVGKIWCYSSNQGIHFGKEQLARVDPSGTYAFDLGYHLFLDGAVRLLVPVLLSPHFAKQDLLRTGLRLRLQPDFPCGPAAPEGRGKKSRPA